ncbi:hypothetical protein ABEF95_001086 [Exophiala dermatitidis]
MSNDGILLQPTEVGSLAASDPDQSEFLGSSSGVYFIDTVFQTFGQIPSEDDDDTQEPYIVKDYFFVSESSNQHDQQMTSPLPGTAAPASRTIYGIPDQGLGSAPDEQLARELIQTYFRTWHPLLPFMHGPSLLNGLEALYSNSSRQGSSFRKAFSQMATYQCLFNISSMCNSTDSRVLPAECQIRSSMTLLTWAGFIATAHDMASLQSLIAIQLYLVSRMELRDAATVGGLLLRALIAAGFHRCPWRSLHMSLHDRDMRKRIFWSAYAIDRFLCQALGMPFVLGESDIDICPPSSNELHRPVQSRGQQAVSVERVLAHLPLNHQSLGRGQNIAQSGQPSPELDQTPSAVVSETGGQDVLFIKFVAWSKIVSQILSLFHKAIRHRVISRDNVLELTSRVHEWWNSLPDNLEDDQNGIRYKPRLGPFFKFLYHQAIILINRPFLSLPHTNPDCRSSLQTSINASRAMLSAAQEHMRENLFLPWAGLPAGIWTAGLVLALAYALVNALMSDNSTSPISHHFSPTEGRLGFQTPTVAEDSGILKTDSQHPKRQKLDNPRDQEHPSLHGTHSGENALKEIPQRYLHLHSPVNNNIQTDVTTRPLRSPDYTEADFDIDVAQFANLDRSQTLLLPVMEGDLSDSTGVFGSLSWDFSAPMMDPLYQRDRH